jgi:hypothetical protein
MGKGLARKGKGKEAADVEKKWHAPDAAADLRSAWDWSAIGSAVAASEKKKKGCMRWRRRSAAERRRTGRTRIGCDLSKLKTS